MAISSKGSTIPSTLFTKSLFFCVDGGARATYCFIFKVFNESSLLMASINFKILEWLADIWQIFLLFFFLTGMPISSQMANSLNFFPVKTEQEEKTNEILTQTDDFVLNIRKISQMLMNKKN